MNFFVLVICLKYLYEELQKLRPNLIKLANEADDNDESIGEIIKTNEQCEKIINQYRFTILNERGAAPHDDNLVNIQDDELSFSLDSTTGSTSANSFMIGSGSGAEGGGVEAANSRPKSSSSSSKGNEKYDPLKELQDLFSHEPAVAQPPPGYTRNNDLSEFLTSANDSVGQFGRMSGAGGGETHTNIENLLSSINVSGVNSAGAKQNNNLSSDKSKTDDFIRTILSF